jgi:hypothetical protein
MHCFFPTSGTAQRIVSGVVVPTAIEEIEVSVRKGSPDDLGNCISQSPKIYVALDCRRRHRLLGGKQSVKKGGYQDEDKRQYATRGDGGNTY